MCVNTSVKFGYGQALREAMMLQNRRTRTEQSLFIYSFIYLHTMLVFYVAQQNISFIALWWKVARQLSAIPLTIAMLLEDLPRIFKGGNNH